jgi:ATP-binding cassette subfamily B protein
MADQIVVLDKGKVIERGSHEELMVQNGHYAHLFTIQAQGYQ